MSEQSLPAKPSDGEPVIPRTRPGPRKDDTAAAPRPPDGDRGRKAKMDRKPGRAAQQARQPADRPPQQRRAAAPDRRPSGGYLRLHIRVDEDAISITDTQLVDGTLVRPSALLGRYAYEVSSGDRLLHADSIPDLRVVRSFAVPDGTGELRGHHEYTTSSYEFIARVPVEDLDVDLLPQINVVLHRVKDPTPTRQLGTAPLGEQFERELREVARLEGIPVEVLPGALRRRLTRGPTGRS